MRPGPQASALLSKWVPVWPSWPVVPPRLWLTGASIGVLVLSLVFKQELWPNHPRAAAWCWALLVLLVLAGDAQSARLLWAWATAYPGPGWVRLLLRGAVLVIGLGTAIMLPFACLLGGWLLWGL